MQRKKARNRNAVLASEGVLVKEVSFFRGVCVGGGGRQMQELCQQRAIEMQLCSF